MPLTETAITHIEQIGEMTAQIAAAREEAWETYFAAVYGQTLSIAPIDAARRAGYLDVERTDAAETLRTISRNAARGTSTKTYLQRVCRIYQRVFPPQREGHPTLDALEERRARIDEVDGEMANYR